MFSDFVNQIKSGAADLKLKAQKFKNKGFLDKAMAGCAWTAFADGDVSSDEKLKMMKHVEHDEILSVFDTTEVIAAFKKWVELFDFDVDVAKAKALKELGSLKGKDAEARMLVRIFISVGASDGDFDSEEKAVVREACLEMGLAPEDFQL